MVRFKDGKCPIYPYQRQHRSESGQRAGAVGGAAQGDLETNDVHTSRGSLLAKNPFMMRELGSCWKSMKLGGSGLMVPSKKSRKPSFTDGYSNSSGALPLERRLALNYQLKYVDPACGRKVIGPLDRDGEEENDVEEQREGQNEEDASEGVIMAAAFASQSSLAGNLMAYATESGQVCVVDIEAEKSERLNHRECCFRTHDNAIFDISFADKDPLLVTAGSDPKCAIFDIETLETISLLGHTSTAKTVRFLHNDSNCLVSGGRDGTVRLWDMRCSTARTRSGNSYHRSYTTIEYAHTRQGPVSALGGIGSTLGGRARRGVVGSRRTNGGKKVSASAAKPNPTSVTAVQPLFDSNYLVSTGDTDGVVKVWDRRKTYGRLRGNDPVMCLPYPGESKRVFGFSSLALDPTGTRLLTSCLDRRVYMFDMTSPATVPVQSFFANERSSSFYTKCCFSPDGAYVLSGSQNNDAFVWDVDFPNHPFLRIRGEDNGCELGTVGWSQGKPSQILTANEREIAMFSVEEEGHEEPTSEQPVYNVELYEPDESELTRNTKHLYTEDSVAKPIGIFPPHLGTYFEKIASPSNSFKAEKLKAVQAELVVLDSSSNQKSKISFRLPENRPEVRTGVSSNGRSPFKALDNVISRPNAMSNEGGKSTRPISRTTTPKSKLKDQRATPSSSGRKRRKVLDTGRNKSICLYFSRVEKSEL
eukprot:Nk52_evm35s255 gene=Nk52_evmTU35s255